MCEIWAIELLPKALKSCPKSNKSANLVTLVEMDVNTKLFLNLGFGADGRTITSNNRDLWFKSSHHPFWWSSGHLAAHSTPMIRV